MNWLPIKNTDPKKPPVEPHAIQSDCGRFIISRVYDSGIPRYQLWRKDRAIGEVFEFSDENIEVVKRYAEEHPHPYRHESGG